MRKERGERGRCAHRAKNANNVWRGGRTDSVVLANSTKRGSVLQIYVARGARKRLQKRGIEDNSEAEVTLQLLSIETLTV